MAAISDSQRWAYVRDNLKSLGFIDPNRGNPHNDGYYQFAWAFPYGHPDPDISRGESFENFIDRMIEEKVEK